MSLKARYDDMNDVKANVVPLGHAEIKSALKNQSEAVFIEEKKMGPDKSVFVKKSLIDIALEFKDKADEIKNKEDLNKEFILDTIESDIENESIENKTTSIENESIENKATSEESNNNEVDKSVLPTNTTLVENVVPVEVQIEEQENNIENNIENNVELEETQQALNSVRNAVSQSINSSIEDTDSNKDSDKLNADSNQITEDIENFKNIFYELKNMTESLVSESIENKIIEIAAELAGYQIDKMPEKYEKKIKSFLKNINCFDEKIAIETNDQDYKALSKIEDFKNLNKDIKFIPNSQISRGDVILNCDGMYYSEKTVKNNQGVKKIK
jgi:hypothetical protein